VHIFRYSLDLIGPYVKILSYCKFDKYIDRG